MKLSGRTPLLRARKLEKKLGVKRIYLKLEGANPSHHKYARIAEVLCKDAIAHHKKTLLVDGTNNYLRALEYFSIKFDLGFKIPRFKKETWKTKRFDQEKLIDARSVTLEKRLSYLGELAKADDAYLCVEGYTHNHISLMAMEELGREITKKLPNIDAVYTDFGHGYTIASLYHVFLNSWIEQENRFPKIYCGLNDAHVLDAENPGHDLASYIQTHESLLYHAKQALRESYGKAIRLTEDELKATKKLLRETEHVKVSLQGSYALAAFIKNTALKKESEGTYIIILDDGRSLMDIEEIRDMTEYSKSQIVAIAKNYLAEYSDPLIEMNDALDNAFDKGYVLIAKQNDDIMGITIIVNTQFENFIPTYHLAYIGTNKEHKGRGIGTELIKRAVEITDGKLSLHVDLDNKNAKKLYEKMGFKHKYNRMIYYGE